MDRRQFTVAGLAAGLAAAGTATADAATAAARAGTAFPKGFQWGVATAAHQIEGNNVNSDFWLLEHLKGSPFAEPSGDACDSYHRYPEDIAIVARLGRYLFMGGMCWIPT